MVPRTTIPYSVILEKRLLPVDKVVQVLKKSGFINVSSHMIRRYLTSGLLERPRMGVPGIMRPNARFVRVFSR